MIENHDLVKWLGDQFYVKSLSDKGSEFEDMTLRLKNGSEALVTIERVSKLYTMLNESEKENIPLELNFDENDFPIHVALLFHLGPESARGYLKSLSSQPRDFEKKMDFGEAIRELKKGRSLYREGWNGKHMFIYLKRFVDNFEPCIVMFTAQDKFQPGWLASQADMLAEDWLVKKEDALWDLFDEDA